jgi:PIN domain nuclease of toxin-antitoxin system
VRLLLDTHAVLWALSAPGRLTSASREAIEDGTHDVFVSTASVWEISIRQALGRLEAAENLPEELEAAAITVLPISLDHALAVRSLPLHHRDPFDRMLIAQATVEGLTIVTRDPRFGPYGVSLLRA